MSYHHNTPVKRQSTADLIRFYENIGKNDNPKPDNPKPNNKNKPNKTDGGMIHDIMEGIQNIVETVESVTGIDINNDGYVGSFTDNETEDEVIDDYDLFANPDIDLVDIVEKNNIYQNVDKFEDPKHIKYKNSYMPNDVYYGLGIENESYIMSDKFIERSGEWIINNRRRERYSVDYWTNYDKNDIEHALSKLDKKQKYKIPVFINSHTFTRCDSANQHKTMYTKLTEPNEKFDGKTIHDRMMESSEYYSQNYEREFLYDGDTFEFTTLNFYKTTVDDCVNELISYKTRFINEINKVFKEQNILKDHFNNELSYSKNFGIINFLANPRNIAICNNSTYHINITLPSRLNEKAEISNIELFKKIHSNAIRGLQWIEPLIIACYGSPDIFSVLSHKFSKGSLRLALSRYISAGTYDSVLMPEGKLLNNFEYDPSLFDNVSNTNITSITTTLNNISNAANSMGSDEKIEERQIYRYANIRDHWYKKYHEYDGDGYISQKMIGFDFNYHKHYNHGIELRIFDYFPEEYLKDIINILLLVCQYTLSNDIDDPHEYDCYYDQMINSIKQGSQCDINENYVSCLAKIFKCEELLDSDSAESSYDNAIDDNGNTQHIFQRLTDVLYDSQREKAFMKRISPNMTKPIVYDYNHDISKMNKNFIKRGDYYKNKPKKANKTNKKKKTSRCIIN